MHRVHQPTLHDEVCFTIEDVSHSTTSAMAMLAPSRTRISDLYFSCTRRTTGQRILCCDLRGRLEGSCFVRAPALAVLCHLVTLPFLSENGVWSGFRTVF